VATEQVTARELKNRTGAVLRRVRGGARIVVTNRGRPVALIVPAAASDSPASQRSADEIWAEIEATLARSEPRHASWREAMRGARSRP
jgi:prevent-host-death family protein